MTAANSRGDRLHRQTLKVDRSLRDTATKRLPVLSNVAAGKKNRAQIIKTLYVHGPLPRVDLARLTGATRAGVGQMVQPLVDSGLLEELSQLASGSSGGKPARPLWFAPRASPMGAIHLLPGRISAAVVSAGGNVLGVSSRRFPAHTRDGDMVVQMSADALKDAIMEADVSPVGIGIAVGGMVDSHSGSIVSMNLAPHLRGLELGPRMSQIFGVAAHVDLHPRAQALGDFWFGQGRGLNSFISLYTGEAIGAGIVLGGGVHRGPAGSGGEVGHTFVNINGEQCRCGQRGCWETIATFRWLRRQGHVLGLPQAPRLTAARLCSLVERGNVNADALLHQYGRHIAVGIANLHQTLAPEAIIFHGDVATGGDRLLGYVEGSLAEMVPWHPAGLPRLLAAPAATDESTLRGAACIGVAKELELDV